MWQNSVNNMFILNALFFSLLRGATWYNNAIYLLFTYSVPFIGYEDDILEVISNLHVQGAKCGKKKNFDGKSFKKLNSVEFMEFVFFQVCLLVLSGQISVGAQNPRIITLTVYVITQHPYRLHKFPRYHFKDK